MQLPLLLQLSPKSGIFCIRGEHNRLRKYRQIDASLSQFGGLEAESERQSSELAKSDSFGAGFENWQRQKILIE